MKKKSHSNTTMTRELSTAQLTTVRGGAISGVEGEATDESHRSGNEIETESFSDYWIDLIWL